MSINVPMKGQELFEGLLARYERRIKKATEHPDPKKLKSNILLYECERDYYAGFLESMREGRPIGAALAGVSVIRALGMQYMEMLVAGQRNPDLDRCFDTIQREGLSGDGCDICSVSLAACFDDVMPVPDYVVVPQWTCSPQVGTFNGMRIHYDVPGYTLHVPSQFEERNVIYITEQLLEVIDDIEAKFPQLKYDEDILIEMHEKNRLARGLHREIFELLKASPCPEAGKDTFRGVSRPNRYPNPDKALDYMRAHRDELGERVAKGQGSVPEERLRLLWAVTGPFLSWDPFEFLESRGVTVPFMVVGAAPNHSYPGDLPGFPYRMDNTAFGRKMTPLEEEAIGRLGVPYHAGAPLWADAIAACCRDLNCDGVVHFMQWGATCIASTKKIVEDKLEMEEGRPVLFMEGRQMDSTTEDARRQAAELAEFVEVCLAAKEARKS